MKKEVYSCLKTLEALSADIRIMWASGFIESAGFLQKRYSDICGVLTIHLTPEEFKMVQMVEPVNFFMSNHYRRDDAKRKLLQNLVTASNMTIAYLRSLDMDLDKELLKEKREINKQREELESKEKQVESLQRTFENLISILSNKKEGIPELLRSRIMEEIKGSHRGMEKNTNPDTKSQKKVLTEEKEKEEGIS